MIKPKYKKGDIVFTAKKQDPGLLFDYIGDAPLTIVKEYEILEDIQPIDTKWAEYYGTDPQYCYKVKDESGLIIDGIGEEILFSSEKAASLPILIETMKRLQLIQDEILRELENYNERGND